MGPPPAVAPLPVAPDRAVLSNRIALLFAKQSALGRTLHRPAQHPSSSPSSPSATTTTSAPSSSFSSLSRGADDQGRSALGKRKRRAAEPREGPEARPSHPAALQGQAVEAPCGDDRTHEQPAAHLVEPSDAASKRRRNKKKRKNKASTSG
ncbi:hypothetical protein HIM_00009 [Hirsutella minnesotensis 3608]|nr:hypothetical protein HIM_00009 [Hirsutella minnesotensis 3608]